VELVTGLEKGEVVERGGEEGEEWLGKETVRKREKVSRRGSFISTQLGV